MCACLPTYTYVFHMCGGQKKASDPLKLELWIVINHHRDARKFSARGSGKPSFFTTKPYFPPLNRIFLKSKMH